jgi:GDP-L-fucose synthase
MVVLVTGGSGMVGHCLRAIKPDWVYLSSKDADLRNYEDTRDIISAHSATVVIHLAANVGGLFKNMNQQSAMLYDNIAINLNVVKACAERNIRLIACLSTCIFPDKTTYPISEHQLHDGPPHDSNFGYAYAKRILEIACRTFPNLDYVCIIPVNIYGPYDNFNLETSHVVPALIHKAYLAKRDHAKINVCGTGKALRQFVYAPDVAQIIVRLVENETMSSPKQLILAPSQEISIRELVEHIAGIYDVSFNFDRDPKKDGQYKKSASNDVLMRLFRDFKFTSLETGLTSTCKWFDTNYNNNIRK